MDNLLVTLIIFVGCLLILVFSGMPIFFALGILGLGATYLVLGSAMAPAVASVIWVGLASYPTSAIVLFIFMGFLLFESGLSTLIYGAIKPLTDRLLPGGLLHTNIIVSAAFAACSGSSVASCATIGAVALPEMEARGYDRGIAAGSVGGGSTLGILIPPSIVLIIYGVIAEESIGELFIAGIIPGLALAGFFMSYIALRVKFQPHLVAASRREKESWGFCLKTAFGVWPVIILILGVMGSIYAGLATPTAAASVGCILVIFLVAIYRRLNWKSFKSALQGTLITGSMILCIILSGRIMIVFLGSSGLNRAIAEWVVSINVSPLIILIFIIIMYLIMGCLMDGLSMMIMTLPIVLPIVSALGYDLVWFGIMQVLFGEAGLLTPPVGVNLFILQGLRPEYPLSQIVTGCFPFFLVIVLMIILLVAFPDIALFLPNLVDL